MRHHVVRIACFVVVILGLTAGAEAQEQRCTNPGLAGSWGYTETGTVMAPSPTGLVPVLAAAVGRYDFDSTGTFSGVQNSSAGGGVSADSKVGEFTMNADCTGTLTLRVYDPSGTTLRRTSVWAIVLVDNATEIHGIMTSMTLPNGMSLAPIMTLTAKRLARDRGNDWNE